jgi:hypothetical protein
LDAFVVDASDYSGHLIRHLLNASEAFPTEWFLRNKSKSCGLSPPDFDLFPKLKKPLRGKGFRSIEEVSNEMTRVIRHIKKKAFRQEYKTFPNVGPL